jgi:methylated-DNA-[protein]-cysteine S-methyltransferase
MSRTTVDSPIGPIELVAEDGALREIRFGGGVEDDPDDVTRAAEQQLAEYFAGARRTFELPLAPEGTAFQRRVWDALLEVPYGVTTSYKAIAERIGAPAAVRAVGAANGANPLPIVIPCHRIVGASGALTGYGGGLPIKRALLDLERGQRPLTG